MVNKDMYLGSYEVLCPNGIGSLDVSRQGAYYLFDAKCPLSNEVLHLYCVNAGACVSIGVPLRIGSELLLMKKVSAAQLKPLGGSIKACMMARNDQEAIRMSSGHTDPEASQNQEEPQQSQAETQNEDLDTAAPQQHDNAADTAQTAAEINDLDQPAENSAEQYTQEDHDENFESNLQSPPESSEPLTEGYNSPPDGWERITDGQINGLASESGALFRIRNGVTHVAIPLLRSKPFALPAYLRWGIPHDLGGAKYLLYKVEGGNIAIL